MIYIAALGAAVGCAACNGVAAVLQKEGADTHAEVTSLDIGLMWRLLRDWRYALGIVLDLLGGVLVLVATHSLPLFLVQSMIATSFAWTFVIERFVLRRKGRRGLYPALGAALAGMIVLSLAAAPERAVQPGALVHWAVVFGPVPLALLGALLARTKNRWSVAGLAALSGLAFGGTAVVGRILLFTPPFWHVLREPLLYAFAVYGVLGMLLFTIGLQRATATAFNTMMITTEALAPALIGILFFGDTVRHGRLWAAAVGVVLTLVGAVAIAWFQDRPATQAAG